MPLFILNQILLTKVKNSLLSDLLIFIPHHHKIILVFSYFIILFYFWHHLKFDKQNVRKNDRLGKAIAKVATMFAKQNRQVKILTKYKGIH